MGTIKFRQVPVNELFEDDGYVYRKVDKENAAFVNARDPDDKDCYEVGELLPFGEIEEVKLLVPEAAK